MAGCARVYLLNPPFFPDYSRSQRSPGVIKSGTLYYPIWLAYAAGALMKAGHEVKLVDAPASRWDRGRVREDLLEFRPDLVVLDTSTPSIENDLEVLKFLKMAHPSARYVLVGTHVSALGEEVLSENRTVDGVCRGEYDDTLIDLAGRIAKSEPPDGLPGLLWRCDDRIVSGSVRPYIQKLDDLPWVSDVYRKFLPIERYFYSITQYPVLTLISGRGCPFRCRYCVYPQTMHGHRYRFRGPEDVVAEMLHIEKELPQVKEIFFEDDTLTVDVERIRTLCRMILEKGSKISWTANSRCDVDYETLVLMKRAHCRLLCVGVESGDASILETMGKKLSVERIERFAKEVRKAGIMAHGCFMVGNEGETPETMERTFQLAKRLGFDTVQFFPLMVYPGTKAYDWAKENGYIQAKNFRDWLDEEGCHNCVISRPGLSSDELVRFCDQARRRYYLRPRYLFSKGLQVIRHPREMGRVFRAARTFARYLMKRG